jgi:acetoin utilization deacetylase AcuC-like enzyme
MRMKVGLVYDPIYLEHDTGGHPENAGRLVAIMSHLEKTGIKDKLISLPPRIASMAELEMVHDAEYISQVHRMAKSGGGWLDPDTIICPKSYEAALYAAGGLLTSIEAVWNKRVNSVFALVRPPGHHATKDRAMGFCLFNNIAVAAKFALTTLGIDRILIVDFDVHHGNGTQDTFYDDPRVLYFSTHQYPFFPGTGSAEELGRGEGEGFTVNFPMRAGWGDQEYSVIFNEVLTRIARRFLPQVILVSAGFDGHWADRLAMMQTSISGFVNMITVLKDLAQELCQGRLIFSLEGGYNQQVISLSVKATFDILLGNYNIADPLGRTLTEYHDGFEGCLRQVKSLHHLEE